MYDENKWNEGNHENEMKHTEQPVNAQDSQSSQNTQNGAQQPQGEHTGRQVYGRLGSGTQNGQPYNGNPNGQSQNGSYYGGQQHQQYYGNQNQYTNPYQQYDYYQGHGQNPNGNGNSHHAPKKNPHMKTAALVTAAALLFGVVSGGTMYGVNRAANTLFPYQSTQAGASSETIGQTAQVPAANTSTTSGNGIVIEDVSAIVDATLPSVVSITNTQVYQSNSWFGQSQTYEVPSSGSGIIVG